MSDLGIYVFAHTRPLHLADTLESLKKQGAINKVELWIDGYQGIVDLEKRVSVTQQVAEHYQVGFRNYHRGQLGFRKLILQAMQQAVQKYDHIIFLEDDCFPARDAIDVFRNELKEIENNDNVFSVYGHPFLMAEDSGYCTRFQGWGWATTADKLKAQLDRLIDCYSMYEVDYLDFVNRSLTPEIKARLDVTPPRLPTYTLKLFFAWDETLALLTALDGMVHKPTIRRVIYNCGIGLDSSRFAIKEKYLQPPFNLVLHEDIWSYY